MERGPISHPICRAAPAESVVRAHLHVVKAGQVTAAVDRVYGAPAPTTALAQRFAALEDDETLLVGLKHDGTVLGQGWPVYDEKVSLEGLPPITEGEAASLMLSDHCSADVGKLTTTGEHPYEARPSSHGCACNMHASAPDAALVVLTALITWRVLRRRR